MKPSSPLRKSGHEPFSPRTVRTHDIAQALEGQRAPPLGRPPPDVGDDRIEARTAHATRTSRARSTQRVIVSARGAARDRFAASPRAVLGAGGDAGDDERRGRVQDHGVEQGPGRPVEHEAQEAEVSRGIPAAQRCEGRARGDRAPPRRSGDPARGRPTGRGSLPASVSSSAPPAPWTTSALSCPSSRRAAAISPTRRSSGTPTSCRRTRPGSRGGRGS
jgi:hypothetical protein